MYKVTYHAYNLYMFLAFNGYEDLFSYSRQTPADKQISL